MSKGDQRRKGKMIVRSATTASRSLVSASHRSQTKDDFLDDLNLWTSKSPKPVAIPWLGFSERELQSLIKAHFELLGYDVKWSHDEDASHEKGVDLECSGKDGKRVLLAVKKDPKTEDVPQLQDLARTPAERRIYVRMMRGTQRFEEETRQLDNPVEFWDANKLEAELNETGLAVQLVLANAEVTTELLNICGILTETGRKFRGKPLTRYDSSDMMGVLWDLKDRAVTLHKCLSLLQLMFEQVAFLKALKANEIKELLGSALRFLSIYGSRPMVQVFGTRDRTLFALIRQVYLKTYTRSNWRAEMMQVPSSPRPGFVPVNSPGFQVESWLSCADFFRRMAIAAHGIEGTLDYMLEGAFGTLRDETVT